MTLSAIWKRFPRLLFALCSLSVMAGFAVITGNTSRPLVSYTPLTAIVKPYMPDGTKIPVSIFVLPRHDQYYVARVYWDGLYSQAAATVGRDGVHTVHFISIDGFTYPLMVELQKVGAVIVPDDSPAEGAVTTTGTIQSPAISLQ